MTGWNVGDRVCALTNGGGYAEYCIAPAAQCLPWPNGYDAVRAARCRKRSSRCGRICSRPAGLRSGEKALVHGGTSGIGVTAIQLAHEFGATVFATAGSDEKCAACVRLAATPRSTTGPRISRPAIKELTGGRGVDVILDMVGGPYATQNIRSLGMDGRLVLIAFLGGSKVEDFDFVQVMVRRLTITGSTMRPRTTAQKGQIAAELREKVWPVLDAGRCAPVIHATFRLAQVAEAHRLMELSQHIGKIMLTVG